MMRIRLAATLIDSTNEENGFPAVIIENAALPIFDESREEILTLLEKGPMSTEYTTCMDEIQGHKHLLCLTVKPSDGNNPLTAVA